MKLPPAWPPAAPSVTARLEAQASPAALDPQPLPKESLRLRQRPAAPLHPWRLSALSASDGQA